MKSPVPLEAQPCELADKDLTKLICSECEFYREGEAEALACGAFNMLSTLIKKKVVSPKDLMDAIAK